MLDDKLNHCRFPVVTLEDLIIDKNGVKDGPGGWLINKSEYVENGVPMLRGLNVLDGRVDLKNVVYITEEKNRQLSASEALPGDILITMRGTFGRAAILPDSITKANMNAALCRIRLQCPELSDYLMWYLNSQIAYKQFKRHGTKAVQDDLNLGYIKALRVILPDERSRNDILSRLLNAQKTSMQKLQQADELLDGMSDSILSALNLSLSDCQKKLCGAVKLSDILGDTTFSAEYYHPERLTAIQSLKASKGLEVKRLSEVVDFCRDIVSVSESPDKYLGLAGVESQTGELSGVNEEAAGQAFAYQAEDVLYGRLRPYLNKVLLAEDEGICSTEFHVMRVKDKTVILPEYLSAIMRSNLILAQTKHMMTGNTHPRIANDDVKNLYIPIPDIDTQEKIVAGLSKRRLEARKLKIEAEQDWQAAKAQFEKELLS